MPASAIRQATNGSSSQRSGQSSGQSKPSSRAGSSGQSSGANGSKDETTKEELLDRAREVNLPGRSSMSKDELEKAVEAEAQVTKDELLEWARKAGIEARASMTKDELRKARVMPPGYPIGGVTAYGDLTSPYFHASGQGRSAFAGRGAGVPDYYFQPRGER